MKRDARWYDFFRRFFAQWYGLFFAGRKKPWGFGNGAVLIMRPGIISVYKSESNAWTTIF